ncbi:AIPR family protein [Fredinandcohnia onubensis]|uniref:AIPR family protein n=1 Tax=Fredinandcohnia onubensis TaxID=1571209 RepID=UPI0015D498B3|nr:AIPR family protein [Fredinandcohnia onubensis]
MTVPETFVNWVSDCVEKFKNDYGINSNRHAFAAWVVGYIHELSDDDAFNQTDTLTQGDGGLDGRFHDEAEQLFHIHQVKYPNNPLETVIGPEPIRDLFSALSIIADERTAADRSDKLKKISSEFQIATENGSKVVLNCIVFGEITDPAKLEFFNKCDANEFNPRGEIWDLKRLYDLYVTRETVEDLTGEDVRIPIKDNSYISVPSPTYTYNTGIGDSIVITFNGKEFAREANKYNPKIFGSNVRYHLGHQNRVNTKIKDTLLSEDKHEYFWHYNNGITILVNDYKFEEGEIILTNPQIVNGCQTVSTMINNHASIPDGVKLLSKIIKIERSQKGKDELLRIAEATNSQSPVKSSDLKTNDPVQREIQANFKTLSQPWHYERKRGEWNSLSAAEKARYNNRRLNMIEVGQVWLSYIGQPAKAIGAKDDIFTDGTTYRLVYSKERDPRLYLLAKKLFDTYDRFFSANNLDEIKSLVRNFDEKTLNRLVRGKKLVVGHSVALIKYIFDIRYDEINGESAQRLIDYIDDENSKEFKERILSIIALTHKKFVANQEEDTDIRQKYKESGTITILKELVDDYVTSIETTGNSLSDVLKGI